MGLHGVDREVKKCCDLRQLFVEHILQDDDAALHGRKLGKARHRGLHRFLTHQHLYRVGARLVGDIGGGVDRLGPAHRAAAQQIECAVVRDPEQPGSKRRHLLHLLQRHKGPGECVLHDILAVDDRSHETRAIAMQLGPQLAGESEQLRPAVALQWGPSCAQAAAPSSIVIPVSPLSPKARPSAYFGSSSRETTFSPKSRGGIGAPKRARYASSVRPRCPA
jgi:hypothetical protein